MSERMIIGLAGLPGSGKSRIVRVARESGFGIIVMGDVIRDELRQKGLAISPQNAAKMMLGLRRRYGPAVIARRCISRMRHMKEKKIIVDGIRSLPEVEEFRRAFPKFRLVAIHSSPETRFRRVFQRGRDDDSQNLMVFHERDKRELTVGLGNAIAMAQHMVVNEKGLDDLTRKTERLLRRVEENWTE